MAWRGSPAVTSCHDRGNALSKRIFYRSAFCALSSFDPASKTYYTRKRNEGKSHHQAVIALARRRINVLHAIIRTRQPYNINYRAAARQEH